MPLNYTWFSNYAQTINNNGLLVGWGDNAEGQVGTGDTVDRSLPVLIGSLSWKQVSGDEVMVSAIRSDGMLFSWGDNTSELLGLVPHYSSLSRMGFVGAQGDITLLYNTSWTQIAASASTAAAIRSDGRLFVWGDNASGQLGLGDTTYRSHPTSLGTSSWTAAYVGGAAGSTSIMAIRSDGTLWSWGANPSGKLGLGDTTPRSSPIQIGTSSWTAVSVGISTAAAIRSDGRLFVWGANASGQLGDSTVVAKSSPVGIGTSSWIAVHTGENFTLGITSDNLLFSWGANAQGQLGQGNTTPRSSPVQIGTSSWTFVAGSKQSNQFGYAIRSDGTLWAWGQSGNGQLGDNTTITRSSPVQIGTSSWTVVNGGNAQAVGITTDNVAFAWGANTSGQFGLGDTVSHSSPVQVGTSIAAVAASINNLFLRQQNGQLLSAGGITTSNLGRDNVPLTFIDSPVQIGTSSWTMVSRSTTHAAAIDTTGRLFTWGSNAQGQLGLGDTVSRVSPTQVGTSSWIVVSGGGSAAAHFLGIRSDGTLWSWGFNNNGQLGQNNVVNRSSPTQIGTSSWSYVATGNLHSLAIRSDHRLFTWGGNGSEGRLGDGTTVARSSPAIVGTLSWKQVAGGLDHSIGITLDNRLLTWGTGGSGQLGYGGTYNTSVSSIAIVGPYDVWDVVSGSTANNAAYAIKPDKSLWSWGNTTTMLGFGDTVVRTLPTQLGTSSWTAVSGGGNVTLAIDALGRLFAWGAVNAQGQQGQGDTVSRSSPVQVGTSSWSVISAGASHALAIDTNGRLFAWGNNTQGQLGLNDTANRSSPVQVGTSSWSVVSTGTSHTSAIDIVGRLFVWGANGSGELGQGDTVSRSSPVQVGTSSWTTVSAGNTAYTAGITSIGELYTWGLNSTGELGHNNTTSRSSPVQIGTSSWTFVEAGQANTFAIDTNNRLFGWGQNNGGRVGDGTTINRSSPVQVGTSLTTTTRWLSAKSSVAGNTSLVLGQDRRLYSVGVETSVVGRLLIGPTTNRNTATETTTSRWTFINATYGTSFGVTTDRRLFGWGENGANFKLGLGDTLNRSSPVQISAGSGFVIRVYPGRNVTFALSQAKRTILPVNITTNTSDYNLYTVVSSDPLYQPGFTDVVVNIDPGVVVNSTTVPTAAFSVPSAFNPLDTVSIENNGTIRGRGGNGGAGVLAASGGSGGAGGIALLASRAITVDNNGTIAGGGGGGGAGGGARREFSPGAPKTPPTVVQESGGGGGGGAGNGVGGASPSATAGSPGPATTSGTGGAGSSTPTPAGAATSGAGGPGGSLGSTGSPGNPSVSSAPTYSGGGGGAAGAAVSGNPLVTWNVTGTILGPLV